MKHPLVSIIVPTYNRENLVIETLESIRDQSYTYLELLILDDGSSDNTVAVISNWIEKYRSRFSNVQLFPFPQNSGKSNVVNRGFDLFTGDYVMVFDSDDLMIQNTVAIEVAHLQSHPTINCLCAGAYLMSGSQKTTVQFHSMRECPNSDNIAQSYGDIFLKGNPIISSTVMMKRSVVKETGYFNPTLRVTHDWDYWIRISQRFTIGFLNVPVINYRVNSNGSISQNKFRLFKEVMVVTSMYGSHYDRITILATIGQQIKKHLWMAKNDRSIKQGMGIFLYGIISLIRYLLTGK